MTPQLQPLIFGKYLISSRLAVGGMGEVFLARQVGVPGFERKVILKSLLPDLAGEPEFVAQFLDEARVAATLNHPNVVSIFEVGQWEGTYYIAMEYIDGLNLSELFKASRRGLEIPTFIAVRIIADAAMGLDHAHQARDIRGQPMGIVHRDVSPQNIMVRTDGVTKVVDFGIARAALRQTRTATGVIKGKFAYMAPEQHLDLPVDARTDQFALGVVAWELCTSTYLFRGTGQMDMRALVLEKEIPPPSTLRPDVPPEVDAAILRMLERDRDRRFPSCADAAAELLEHLEPPSLRTRVDRVGTFVVACRESATTSPSAPSPARDNFVIELNPHQVTAPDARARELVETKPDRYHQLPSTAAQAPTEPELSRRGKMGRVALGAGLAVVLGAAVVMVPRLMAPADNTSLPPAEPPAPTPTPAPGPATAAPSAAPAPALTQAPTPQPSAPRDTKPARTRVSRKSEPIAPAAPAQPSTAPNPAVGFLSVSTTPWARVSVDGADLGTTPLFKRSLPPGTHRLAITNAAQGIAADVSATIVANETLKLRLACSVSGCTPEPGT